LVLREQREALACQLLEDLVLLLHEEQKLAETTVLDEFPLHLNSVKEHRGQGDDYHLLVDLRNLRQRLQDAWDNLLADDLLLAVFLH
jgi:hypothetical protein